MEGELSQRERALWERQVRRKRLSLLFSILSVAAAAGLAAAYAVSGRVDAPRAALVLLILIGAKNHLRIYRLSAILEKLARR